MAGNTIMSKDELINSALNERNSAKAFFSNFRVGTILVAEKGKIYRGCNIEISSYGLTICAERVAIFKAVSEGEMIGPLVENQTRHSCVMQKLCSCVQRFHKTNKTYFFVATLFCVNMHKMSLKILPQWFPEAGQSEDLHTLKQIPKQILFPCVSDWFRTLRGY